MAKNIRLLILGFTLLQFSAVLANEIIIGPYLHFDSPQTMIVRWETLEPSPSILEYNIDGENFYTLEELSIKTKHEALIQGFEFDTNYQYRIFDKKYEDGEDKYIKLENQAKLNEFNFKTRPEDDDTLKLWVLGDPGVKGDPKLRRRVRRSQPKVKKAFFKYLKKNEINNKEIDYVVALGDNAYAKGTWEEYKNGFFTPYAGKLHSYYLYSVFGNHDQGLDKRGKGLAPSARSYPKPSGIYYDFFELPGNRAYYSVDEKHAHLIFLDTTDSLWEDYNGKNFEVVWSDKSKKRNRMLDWLKKDLKQNDKEWTVVFFHHPPFGQNEHPEEKLSDIWKAWTNAYIAPLLDEYKVDLVLTGHIHNYQRSYPISVERKDIDRSVLTERTNIKEEKRAFIEKNCAILDELKLPNYKPVVSSQSKRIYSKSDDPIYVIMGSSGAAFKNLPEKPSSVFFKAGKVAGSALLEINKEMIDFKFINKKAKVFDHLVISKKSL